MRRRIIAYLLVLSMLCGSLPVQAAEAIFKDVSPGHWSYAALYELFKRGVIKGYLEGGERLYKGNKPLTRYEFAAALEKLILNLEEQMVILDSERVKMEYVDAAVAKSVRENKRTLADTEERLNVVDRKTMNTVNQLEDRMAALEKEPVRKPLPNWLIIGTTVVAVTALVIAAGK